MPTSYSLGEHFESFVQRQLDSGRYNNASEVLRDALRIMEERDRLMSVRHDAIHGKIAAGMASLRAGRCEDGDAIFDELDARLADDRSGAV